MRFKFLRKKKKKETFQPTQEPEVLMREIDANVKKLMDAFRFILKYRILLRGRGIEFAGLREYTQHDDASLIDWKSSVRLNKLYVKQFEEERDLDVFILLDTSSSMLFGTTNQTKSEYAAVLAGTFAYAGVTIGDNVGLGLFSDEVKVFVPPMPGPDQYFKILDVLVNPKMYGGDCNLTEALNFCVENLRTKTILFVISDFIGAGKAWKDPLKSLCGKLERVFGLMVRDIRDTFLPEGVGLIRFSDPYTGKTLVVNIDKVKDEFKRLAKRQETEVETEFISSGAHFIKIYTIDPFVIPLVKYFNIMFRGV